MKTDDARKFVNDYVYELAKQIECRAIEAFGEAGAFKGGTYNAYRRSAVEAFDAFVELSENGEVYIFQGGDSDIVLSNCKKAVEDE